VGAGLFSAFGHDEVEKIGTETTINSGDIAGILMIAVQVLESARRSSTEGSADCCAGGAAGRAGVTTEALYSDNSRATGLLNFYRFNRVLLTVRFNFVILSRADPAREKQFSCTVGGLNFTHWMTRNTLSIISIGFSSCVVRVVIATP
jgi:hypothetical protein